MIYTTRRVGSVSGDLELTIISVVACPVYVAFSHVSWAEHICRYLSVPLQDKEIVGTSLAHLASKASPGISH